MKSKPPQVKVAGQRCITSTALFRSSTPNQSSDTKDGVRKIKASERDSRVSLSDFLNNKLHKSSVLPNSTQEKRRPFLSPLSNKYVHGSEEGHDGVKKNEAAETKAVPDVVFEQFKWTREESKDGLSSCPAGDDRESRKRKSPFADGKPCTRKPLVVLGDISGPACSTPNRVRSQKNSITEEKPRQIYNHYANGGGWWDCNMEGVDNEEVGCNEVWEGIGSATLGGLDWH